MTAIDPVASRSAGSHVELHHAVVPLAERMSHFAKEPDRMDDVALTTGELVTQWAVTMFVEKIFFGDEEESGIPDLSIDI